MSEEKTIPKQNRSGKSADLFSFYQMKEGREAILTAYKLFKVPIIITENGISTHDEIQREQSLERALYIACKASEIIGSQSWEFLR